MTSEQHAELKWCADHMRTAQAEALGRFECLLRAISQRDRRDLVVTLREMIADATCRPGAAIETRTP